MRSPSVSLSLLWIAFAAVPVSAQNAAPAAPTAPTDKAASSGTKFKSPDEAIMKFGHVLGDVVGKADEQEKAVRSDADARIQAKQKQLDDIDNGVDPEAAKYMQDAPPVEAACPQGKVMPVEQANACNARIAALNAQFAKLKARHDDLLNEKNQLAFDEANQIAVLEQRKVEAKALDANIVACSGNADVMTKKACLDRIFDNKSVSPYDLDAGVVKPDYFGTTKTEANIIPAQNKVHDDGQIRKVMSKKVTVPPPAPDSAPKN